MRSHSLYIHSIGSALAPTSHCSCACIHHDLCGTAYPVHCNTPISVSGYGGTSKIPPRIQVSARGSPSHTARRVCRGDIFIEDWTVSLCGTAYPVHCSTTVSVSGYGGTSQIPPRIQLSARGSPSPTARRVSRGDIFIEDWTGLSRADGRSDIFQNIFGHAISFAWPGFPC